MSWAPHYVAASQADRLQLIAAGALTARRSSPYSYCFDCEAGDRLRAAQRTDPNEPR